MSDLYESDVPNRTFTHAQIHEQAVNAVDDAYLALRAVLADPDVCNSAFPEAVKMRRRLNAAVENCFEMKRLMALAHLIKETDSDGQLPDSQKRRDRNASVQKRRGSSPRRRGRK